MKILITEISENDFRKLNIKVFKTELERDGDGGSRYAFVEKNLNDILDKEIEYNLQQGYESNLQDLKTPVTIAIHKEPTEEDCQEYLKSCSGISTEEARVTCSGHFTYLDKFMNQFTGAQTFQIGWGIKHLYSTRDYYESHEDYWRVPKKDTQVIYRVYLNERPFTLKHKTVIESKEHIMGADIEIEANYDLIGGDWVLRNKTKVTKLPGRTICEPYSKN